MPQCSQCRHRFRTLEDETDMHDCPRCGYGPREPEYCAWCSAELERSEDYPHYPYCSKPCSVLADEDNRNEGLED